MDRNGAGDDARIRAARYRVDRLDSTLTGGDARTDTGPDAEANTGTEADTSAGEPSGSAGAPGMQERAHFVEMALQQAMRRGDFDDLPGAGKPLDLGSGTHDPDWWIRRKIEREKLTGLGPPALTLRSENAALDARLDAMMSERAVRDALEEFNTRVVEARRQLLGGPPVVTATRDVDDEVARWNARRSERDGAAAAERQRDADTLAALSRRERRRVLRSRPPWKR